MTDQERAYQLALSMINGVGFSLWKNFIEHFGNAENLYNTSRSTLANVHKHHDVCKEILEKKHLSEAEQLIQKHNKNNIKIVSYFDDKYPKKLKQIPLPPMFLYCKGDYELNNALRSVAIVGTRTPSSYGKIIASEIVEDLKKYNVEVVSGLAYGIDVIAHDVSIHNSIPTIAVLAGSLDKIYPSVHKPIANKIIESGGMLISESPLGLIAESYHFPARNRIIAGCTDLTIVIEAGGKSGSLITAQYANDYNRDVFAIPGNVNNPMAKGCNMLIQKNLAHLITSADDVSYIMNWPEAPLKAHHSQDKKYNNLDQSSKQIVDIITEHPNISVEEILTKIDVQASNLSVTMMQLEMENIISTVDGIRYNVKKS